MPNFHVWYGEKYYPTYDGSDYKGYESSMECAINLIDWCEDRVEWAVIMVQTSGELKFMVRGQLEWDTEKRIYRPYWYNKQYDIVDPLTVTVSVA